MKWKDINKYLCVVFLIISSVNLISALITDNEFAVCGYIPSILLILPFVCNKNLTTSDKIANNVMCAILQVFFLGMVILTSCAGDLFAASGFLAAGIITTLYYE